MLCGSIAPTVKGRNFMQNKDNRYRYNSDLPRPSSYNKRKQTGQPLDKNSDNEQTQYIGNMDSFSDTAEIPYYEDSRQTETDNMYRPQSAGNRNNMRNSYYGRPQSTARNNYNNHPNHNNSSQAHQRSNGRVYRNETPHHQERRNTVPQNHQKQMRSEYEHHPRTAPTEHERRPRPVAQENKYRQRTLPDDESRKNTQIKKKRPPQQPPVQYKKKRKKKRRFGLVSRIILSIVTLVVVIFAIYSAVSLALIKKIHYVESNITSYSGLLDESYVKNVLLIGTDGRTVSDRGRSDTMILLSINSKTDEIFLTSLMRDSYVDISGYGWNKLNAAYSFGGPELLIDTIQRNFDVKVTDYIAVNFNAFAAVVDAVDGVEINVSDSEAEAINQILHDEVNELMGDAIDSDYLSSGGKYKLNGKQALSYARIRYVGNADFERTERQREVLSKIADNMKTFNPKKLTGVMKAALPEMTTNMKTRELYLLSLRLPFLLRYDIEQLRVPADDTWTGNNVYIGDDLSSVLEVDFNANIDMLKQKVFTDKK